VRHSLGVLAGPPKPPEFPGHHGGGRVYCLSGEYVQEHCEKCGSDLDNVKLQRRKPSRFMEDDWATEYH
jgi:hypothetical protein